MRNRALGPYLCLRPELASSLQLYLPLNSSNPKNVHGPIWLSLDDSWRAATGKMFFGIFALSSLAAGASSAQTMFMDLSRTPDAREERETVGQHRWEGDIQAGPPFSIPAASKDDK